MADMHGDLDFDAIKQMIGMGVQEMNEKSDVWANRYVSDVSALMARIERLEGIIQAGKDTQR